MVFYVNRKPVVELSDLADYERYYPCLTFGNAGSPFLPAPQSRSRNMTHTFSAHLARPSLNRLSHLLLAQSLQPALRSHARAIQILSTSIVGNVCVRQSSMVSIPLVGLG